MTIGVAVVVGSSSSSGGGDEDGGGDGRVVIVVLTVASVCEGGGGITLVNWLHCGPGVKTPSPIPLKCVVVLMLSAVTPGDVRCQNETIQSVLLFMPPEKGTCARRSTNMTTINR